MTGELCGKMKKDFNLTIPDCQATAEKIWGFADKACQEGSDLEKLFCEMAHDKEKEDEMVNDMCTKLQSFEQMMFNVTVPLSSCQHMAKYMWDSVANLCPKNRGSIQQLRSGTPELS